MQFQPLEILHEVDRDDEQCRIRFSLNDFAEREKASYLDALFYYWSALSGGGRAIPRLADFHPSDVFDSRTCHWIRAIDVSAGRPEGYVVLDHHSKQPAPLPDGMHGRLLTDFPSRMHVEATIREYTQCRNLKLPAYHEINQIVCGVPRHYTRLLLPLADDRGDVVRLAYGVVKQKLNQGLETVSAA